ncbi:dehydrogenase [Ramlibacter sp. AW1]|uniref:Dehydrogenase n=1 Tax=Ramlibacter aurantiacus TaxID=2801330 RepID=A0A936ZX41_9BURK|nr:YciI family protein [Ramlibacter aurantiacus]MBL0422715.1 dehydrogenase [Ramlibacter aurantiacus]
MPYMLLILEPPGQREARAAAEGEAAYAQMTRWAGSLRDRGVLLDGESLASRDGSPARVRVRGGQAEVLDGPFTEAKELIGGYFLLDVATREQAIELARECPAAEWAAVEVRRLGPCFT